MEKRELFGSGASYLAPRERTTHSRIGKGRRAWKYVEVPYARGVARGDVYVGTLQHFATIENGRGDDIDGGYAIYSGTLLSGRLGDRAALNNIHDGLGEAQNVAIVGCEYRRLLGDIYAICASEVGTPRVAPKGPEVLFEITDIYALAERITQAAAARVDKFEVAEVMYCQRRFDAHDAVGNDLAREDAFYKEARHSHERELRAAFGARQGGVFAPFSVGDDKLLAELLRPVPAEEWPPNHPHLRALDMLDG